MPTTIKEGIANMEKKTNEKASETVNVKLYAQYPPIEKMDASLSTLACCEKLSLSTNCIEKIANLNGLKHLKILSIGRNNIKALNGLEAVADTLEQLWMSYNNVEKLKGIGVLRKLQVLLMSNNKVSSWSEFEKLKDCPNLKELNFVGNPLEENERDSGYRDRVKSMLAKLSKLDGSPLLREE